MNNLSNSDEGKFRGLRRFNGAMGVLHLFQAALMLYLSSDFTLPITTSNLITRPIGRPELATDVLMDVRLGPLVALFLLISAIAHFAVSTVGYDWYVKKLKNHINPARWVEYTFSASIMIVIIAMLTGIFDLAMLLLLFTLNATMIWFGWMMELYNQKTEETSWIAFIFGSLAGIVPWIAIAIYLGGAVMEPTTAVPDFVIYIWISIFIFFNIFALNQLLQYKEVGPWKDYLFGEKMYIVLSLVAKSALAWQVFAGTLM